MKSSLAQQLVNVGERVLRCYSHGTVDNVSRPSEKILLEGLKVEERPQCGFNATYQTAVTRLTLGDTTIHAIDVIIEK